MPRNALRDYWDRRRSALTTARVGGIVSIRVQGDRLQVSVPYREEFIPAAKDLGGRWRYRTGFWSFPWSNRRSVLALVRTIYGEKAMGAWGTFSD